LAAGALRTLGPSLGIDDPQDWRRLWMITDQWCAGAARASLSVAGGKFVGLEVDNFWWLARSAGGHVHHRFSEPIRRPNHIALKIERRKPFGKAFDGCGVYPLAPAEDVLYAAE